MDARNHGVRCTVFPSEVPLDRRTSQYRNPNYLTGAAVYTLNNIYLYGIMSKIITWASMYYTLTRNLEMNIVNERGNWSTRYDPPEDGSSGHFAAPRTCRWYWYSI